LPEAAARILVETYLAARRLGIYHHQMCERIGPFVNGTWRRYSCAGCGGKVVVAPNGEAGICEYNAGDGRSYVPLAEFSADAVSDFLSWAGRSPLDTKECVQCPALATCGGGCAYDSQELLGDALAFDTWLCETNVAVVRWLMQDLLAQLQERLRGRDFHVVTAAERALVLGGVALDGANVSMAHVVRHGETACACARCPCQCPAQPG
jgi:radical SAM protein with 4Fe4S-binding SPASM domain